MDRTDAANLTRKLDESLQPWLDNVDVFAEIESTNTFLLDSTPPASGRFHVALANQQTAGRGRRNNQWHSPPGSGLYLSIAYTFENPQRELPCLTLAAGVAVVDALQLLGVTGVALKWPNDLVLNDGKLGGILTELRPGNANAASVVLGLGLNVALGGEAGKVSAGIGRVADIAEVLQEVPPTDRLAADVLGELLTVVRAFDAHGFAPFSERWTQYDWLANRPVVVELANGAERGTAAGIDHDGALLLNQSGDVKRIVSGSVLPDKGAAA